jgi:hypothetical protein
MTKIRFQADADLKQAIVTGTIRREPNIDFQSAYAAGLEGKLDREVLAIAAEDGRVLVTHDRSDNVDSLLILCSAASTRFQATAWKCSSGGDRLPTANEAVASASALPGGRLVTRCGVICHSR